MDEVKCFTSNKVDKEQLICQSCGVYEGRLLGLFYTSVPVFPRGCGKKDVKIPRQEHVCTLKAIISQLLFYYVFYLRPYRSIL
jgi:hypothetical protein